VLRIFAPEEPFKDDDTLKSVYDAFLEALSRLDDPSATAFQPAHALLQNVATIGLCVPMLDLECSGAEKLVPRLFEVLFAGVNPANSSLVEEDATKVLGTMLEEAEEVSPEVLMTILERLVQPFKGENSAAHNLACSLVRKSENNLQLAVQH
jgi:sister-chromatid-cohesion protein PDS5